MALSKYLDGIQLDMAMAACISELRKNWRQQCPTTNASPVHLLPEKQDGRRYTTLAHHSAGAPGNPLEEEEPLWYLAYGSNLAAETFLGRRNIHPITAVNVVVPQLRLAFNIPGIPYSEPCFANSATRDGYDPPRVKRLPIPDDKEPPYHKDRWHKGLVGVAYKLTPSDYKHVIASEGGGAAYQDVVVDSYILPHGVNSVPTDPDTELLKVHTLFAPQQSSQSDDEWFGRPDPSYAQPSARYLKLLTDGADEHSLPQEYKEYLHQIRSYQITSSKQKLGAYIFLGIWQPVFTAIISLMPLFSDKNGKLPEWTVRLISVVFQAVWSSYDGFFCTTFGDGERTEGEGLDHKMTHCRNKSDPTNGERSDRLLDEKCLIEIV